MHKRLVITFLLIQTLNSFSSARTPRRSLRPHSIDFDFSVELINSVNAIERLLNVTHLADKIGHERIKRFYSLNGYALRRPLTSQEQTEISRFHATIRRLVLKADKKNA